MYNVIMSILTILYKHLHCKIKYYLFTRLRHCNSLFINLIAEENYEFIYLLLLIY